MSDITCANGVIHVIDTVLSKKKTYDLLSGSKKFNTLITALNAVDLSVILSGSTPYTVFAPTDAAFAKLPTGMVADLLKPENVDKLEKLLQYHVVGGKVMAADVVKLTFAPTLADGLNVSIRVGNGKVILNNSAQVTITDIVGSNGVVVHVIDTVLSPQTVYQLLDGSKQFITLVTALNAIGLTDLLSSPVTYTIFAPKDATFAKLPAATVPNLLKPENVEELRTLVKNHVVAGKGMAHQIVDDSFATTLAGYTAYLNKNGDDTLINGTKITSADVVASNGVIHVIDGVLTPPRIYDMMSHIDSLEVFATLVDSLHPESELKASLLGEGDDEEGFFTAFFPVNGGMEDQSWLNNLTPEKKEDFISCHIGQSNNPFYKSDLEDLTSVTSQAQIDTLAGTPLILTNASGGEVMVNGSDIEKHDIICIDGILHTVSNVVIEQEAFE
jgi:uncharacterized surface protein with fasciclin (FAS1) repeats